MHCVLMNANSIKSSRTQDTFDRMTSAQNRPLRHIKDIILKNIARLAECLSKYLPKELCINSKQRTKHCYTSGHNEPVITMGMGATLLTDCTIIRGHMHSINLHRGNKRDTQVTRGLGTRFSALLLFVWVPVTSLLQLKHEWVMPSQLLIYI